jgi:hypothetical protein
MAMTLGKEALGLPATMTGSVSFSGIVTDAEDGKVLFAFLTKQSPPAIDLTSGLGETRAARLGITQGAGAFRSAVDRLTGR